MSKNSRNICKFLSVLGLVFGGNLVITPSSSAIQESPCVCAYESENEAPRCESPLTRQTAHDAGVCRHLCLDQPDDLVLGSWLGKRAWKDCQAAVDSGRLGKSKSKTLKK